MKQETPLKFCSYNGSVCCNTTQDLLLQKQFEALNVIYPVCASLLKSTMCAVSLCQAKINYIYYRVLFSCQLFWSSMMQICDQFSAHLFKIDSRPRKVPVLCNTTSSMKSHQSKVGDFSDFCTKLWNTCGNISLLSSPFAPPTQGRTTDHWHSKEDFCEAFGGSEDAVCFNGESVSFSQVDAPPPPAGLCLEKIGNGAYINLVPHPDGSNRAFVSNQQGQIWLVTIPHE